TLFAGFHPYSWALIPVAILVMFLLGLLFSALGLMFGSLLTDFQGFQLIMNFMVMPLFFLSGSLFPLQGAPPLLQWIARFDPLTYGIDAMRDLLINVVHYGIGIDFLVLGVIALVFVMLGSYFFNRIQI